jgi:hypothetical protein
MSIRMFVGLFPLRCLPLGRFMWNLWTYVKTNWFWLQSGTLYEELSIWHNPFQSNFSATHILPSSYWFWAGKRLVDYLSVLHEEKRRTGSDSRAGEQTQQKKCQTSSDIGAEQENHNVGQGPTLDQKGLKSPWSTLFKWNGIQLLE